MILGFKTKFPWGQETRFAEKILLPHFIYDPIKKYFSETICIAPKVHTIREGQRWKAGDWIHMATGVRTKFYKQFNKGIPELAKCRSTQRIDIIHRGPGCAIIFVDRKVKFSRIIRQVEPLGTFEFGGLWFNDFWKNDGFDCEVDFWKWFSKPLRNGQIIHWTDLKY